MYTDRMPRPIQALNFCRSVEPAVGCHDRDWRFLIKMLRDRGTVAIYGRFG